MLEVSNLHLWRGDRHLLRGVNFTLFGGQVLQLLWPNGTGKTSLLRCIAGFLHAEEGGVRWNGSSMRWAPPSVLPACSIGGGRSVSRWWHWMHPARASFSCRATYGDGCRS